MAAAGAALNTHVSFLCVSDPPNHTHFLPPPSASVNLCPVQVLLIYYGG